MWKVSKNIYWEQAFKEPRINNAGWTCLNLIYNSAFYILCDVYIRLSLFVLKTKYYLFLFGITCGQQELVLGSSDDRREKWKHPNPSPTKRPKLRPLSFHLIFLVLPWNFPTLLWVTLTMVRSLSSLPLNLLPRLLALHVDSLLKT